jgi:hypothetical protein
MGLTLLGGKRFCSIANNTFAIKTNRITKKYFAIYLVELLIRVTQLTIVPAITKVNNQSYC